MPIQTSGQIGMNDLIDEFGQQPRTADSGKIQNSSKRQDLAGSWDGAAVPLSDYYRGLRVPNTVGNEGVPILKTDKNGFPIGSLSMNQFYGAIQDAAINVFMPDLAVGGDLNTYAPGGGNSSWITRNLDRRGANVALDVTALSYKITVSPWSVGIQGKYQEGGKGDTDGYSGLRNPGLRVFRLEGSTWKLIQQSRGTGESIQNSSTVVDVDGFTLDLIGGRSGNSLDKLRFEYVADFYYNNGVGTPAYYWDNVTVPNIRIQSTRLDGKYLGVAAGDSTGVVTASVVAGGGKK